jgi:hypothetical protein
MDALSMVIDSHLSTILLTPSLQTRLDSIKSILSDDMRVISLLERKLKGCLAAFHIPEETRKAGKLAADMALAEGTTEDGRAVRDQVEGKALRMRWKRMVHDVQDGVGRYAVEVMKF